LFLEGIGLAMLFLLQPLIIAFLVLFALDQFNAGFSDHAWYQLRHLLIGSAFAGQWAVIY
jgi:hypothetical protein